ncbi:MAG: permease-like cell division protein FtsX [Pseudomonadota bacterium]
MRGNRHFRSWLQAHRESAVDSLARLWRHRLGSLMTLSVIGIALLLPALLLTGVNALSAMGDGLQDSARITLYLRDDVTDEEQQSLRDSLAGDARINEVLYISPEEAAREFARYSGFADVISVLPRNPLPATIELLPAVSEPEAVERLAREMADRPQVADMQVDLDWVQRLATLMELGRRLSLALATIIAVAVVFIVGNTIRLAIESRRDEIMVVKLIGGTDAFVARPFLYTGALYGLGGGLLGALLLWLLYRLIEPPLQQLSAQYGDGSLSATTTTPVPLVLIGLLAISTVLGWLGAQLSVRRHLHAIEPD